MSLIILLGIMFYLSKQTHSANQSTIVDNSEDNWYKK